MASRTFSPPPLAKIEDVEFSVYTTPLILPALSFKKILPTSCRREHLPQPVPAHLIHRLDDFDAYGPCESESDEDSEADVIFEALAPIIIAYLNGASATLKQIEEHIGGLPHQRESTRNVTQALTAAGSLVSTGPGVFTYRNSRIAASSE